MPHLHNNVAVQDLVTAMAMIIIIACTEVMVATVMAVDRIVIDLGPYHQHYPRAQGCLSTWHT